MTAIEVRLTDGQVFTATSYEWAREVYEGPRMLVAEGSFDGSEPVTVKIPVSAVLYLRETA